MKKISAVLWLCVIGLVIPALVMAGKPGQVNGDLDKLQKYRSTLPDAGKAMGMLASGEMEKAERLFRGILKVFPGHPEACYGLAVIDGRRGDLEKALSWIKQAEAAYFSMQRIWKRQMSKGMNMTPEEQRRMRELTTQGIDRTRNSVFCDAQSLLYNKTARSAKDGLHDGDLESSPFRLPAEIPALQGNLMFKLRRLPGAERKYLEALAIDPGHERSMNNLINIYYVTRRFDLARQWLETARQLQVKIHPGLEKAVQAAE